MAADEGGGAERRRRLKVTVFLRRIGAHPGEPYIRMPRRNQEAGSGRAGEGNRLTGGHVSPPRPAPITEHAAMAEAAIRTLEELGYTYCGGTLWKPPLGAVPLQFREDVDQITNTPWFGEARSLAAKATTILDANLSNEAFTINLPGRWSLKRTGQPLPRFTSTNLPEPQEQP
ncbi:MAG: hypothetical protein E7K72_27850 [Roseomonas mucosa]|nr:hypothetical protein [Roseomonas mucosa]